MGTPWGTLALVAQRALEPLGYEVRIESMSWGGNNPRYVTDGRADLGATQYRAIEEAYQGSEGREPIAPNLRLIAVINQPAWIAVAVRAASGITDLSEIASKQMAIGLKAGGEGAIRSILDYYGLSRDKVLSWGGYMVGANAEGGFEAPTNPNEEPARWHGDLNVIAPWIKEGKFDLIVDPIYAAYTVEHRHWIDASVLHDLRFLPLPQDLINLIMERGQAEAPGFIPHRLMRGVDEDIPTVQRFPQAYYTRDDVPEDFIYDVAKALDNGRHLFRQTHMPYSYDPLNVAGPRRVPLHPGAERYYREAGYPLQGASSKQTVGT
jgi:TRAP-type uncharacterized transport system substrate-binding protein